MKKDIQDIVRQRLYDREVPPPPFVWEGVEHQLRQRRRRRFLGWWWLGGTLAVVGAAAWWALGTPSGVTDATHFLVEKKPAERTPTQAEVPAAQPHGVASAVRDLPNFSTQKNTALPLASEVVSSTPTTTVSDNQPTAQSASATNLNSHSFVGFFEKNVDNQIVAAQNLPHAPEPVWEASPAVLPISRSLAGRLPQRDMGVFSFKKTPAPALKKWPIRALTKRKKDTPKNCYDFEQHRNVWMFEAYAGPSYQRKQLQLLSGPEWADYRAQRLATESAGWGFNAGLRGVLVLRQHFKIRTGLHYDQYTEVFGYQDPSSIEYLIKQVIDVNTGQTVIDTVDVRFGTQKTTTYNRFGMLDVPLELGYELRSGRMGVGLQGGVSANLWFWKRGSLLSPTTGTPAVFTPDAPNAQSVFVTKMGLSAVGSIQWFWHVRPHSRLFVEPSYRHVLQPVTRSSHPLAQRSHLFNLRLGWTRIF
jgi:hypothetical protein